MNSAVEEYGFHIFWNNRGHGCVSFRRLYSHRMFPTVRSSELRRLTVAVTVVVRKPYVKTALVVHWRTTSAKIVPVVKRHRMNGSSNVS